MTDLRTAYDEPAFRPRSMPTQASLARMMVAQAYDVPLEEIAATTRRNPRAALARQVAMYLAHVVLGMTMSEIADAFGRDRTTASYACQRIEDLRENPTHDGQLEWLEAQLRRVVMS